MDSPAHMVTPETRNRLFAKFDRLHLPDFGKVGKFASMVGVATAFAVAGIGKAQAREQMPNKAKIGAEISAIDTGFENSNDLIFSPLAQIKEQATELSGPQVQFFNVVALDNPQNTVNPKIEDFISGLQYYAREHGDGLRVRVAQSDGQYEAPLIRIGMTQSEIIFDNRNNNALKVIKAVTDRIAELKFAFTDRINVGLIEGNMGGGCFLLPIGAANPGNLEIINISTSDTPCPTSNSPNGFSALNVVTAQGLIWIPRIGNFVKDPLDTMSDLSLINSRSWAWALTRFNHSNTYGVPLHSSKYFQHNLVIAESGNGTGNVLKSPSPDKCYLDCGSGLLYPAGTLVTLKAETEAGSKFAGFKNCPQPEGDVCKVPMTEEQSIIAEFIKTVIPPKTSILIASKMHDKKNNGDGKILFNGKERLGTILTTRQIGKLIVLKLVPNPGSILRTAEGCDNLKAHKTDWYKNNMCYVYMVTVDNPSTANKEAEIVKVGFAKSKPKPPKFAP